MNTKTIFDLIAPLIVPGMILFEVLEYRGIIDRRPDMATEFLRGRQFWNSFLLVGLVVALGATIVEAVLKINNPLSNTCFTVGVFTAWALNRWLLLKLELAKRSTET